MESAAHIELMGDSCRGRGGLNKGKLLAHAITLAQGVVVVVKVVVGGR